MTFKLHGITTTGGGDEHNNSDNNLVLSYNNTNTIRSEPARPAQKRKSYSATLQRKIHTKSTTSPPDDVTDRFTDPSL